jgi:hypothetical protein
MISDFEILTFLSWILGFLVLEISRKKNFW